MKLIKKEKGIDEIVISFTDEELCTIVNAMFGEINYFRKQIFEMDCHYSELDEVHYGFCESKIEELSAVYNPLNHIYGETMNIEDAE